MKTQTPLSIPIVKTEQQSTTPSRQRRSVFWKIRSDIPKQLYYMMVALSLLLPVLGWALLTYGGFVEPLFLPTPTGVIQQAIALLQSGELIHHALTSISRVAWGFLMSALISIPLGLLIGTFKSMEGLFEPIVALLRYMPAAAFIPLIILWVGLGEPSKVVIIFLGSFFYNTLMIADAVKFIPNDFLRAAYTMGVNRKDVFLHVIFPATLPNIIDTLRINVAGAWNFVVVAELVGANSGLGNMIMMAQRFLKTDEIFVGIILIGLIGLGIDCIFKLIFKLTVPWAVNKS
ncbi:ABC transporter permease [Oscillatoria sp. FACHB-1407]|uniref:ABC transporter permease n=1 Tax=Oscillatoria sp. FACHB-1407 TaxID=2692847 RepID=UPI001686AF7F|nr:ABC transporter permease [Oscillatoria sp. FACHB-1407]MBD2463546.1 ABC transporter permease [Oscillatoria sp. FACHB-1407]